MSWYRTYRPQTVAALHIAPVREAMERILASGEFSHAYLLTGPKGTGKTSTARILAKVLNCEKNRAAIERLLAKNQSTGQINSKLKAKSLSEPCNACQACLSIAQGSSLCVNEMDAASNRGIDDIRALTERIGLSAGDGPISVVIIDEVHMLTTEAFNALLKVLEEPPSHVVFILATTDAQKLPATVVSRCQVIQYRKASSEEIQTALRQIAASEKVDIDAGALLRLVAYADGSFRDGVKALEQIAMGRAKVTAVDLNAVLGISITEISEDLVQALAKRDHQKVVQIFTQMEENSTDVLLVQKEVLRSLHARMIAAPAAHNPHFVSYVALMKSLNLPSTPSLPFPGFPFEIACLEWCLQSGSREAKIIPEDLKKKLKLLPTELIKEENPPLAKATEGQEKAQIDLDEPLPSVQVSFAAILEQWHLVLASVRQKNSSIEALLKTTRPLGVENNLLRLEVFYQFHKDQLALDRNLTIIEDILAHTFAAHIRLEFVLGKKAVVSANLPDSNLSGIVDTAIVKAAEEAFLS